MGDDSYQEGWINCSLHSRDGRSYSSTGESTNCPHEEDQELVRRNNELEEELKSTCDGYEEEIVVLLEKKLRHEEETRNIHGRPCAKIGQPPRRLHHHR